MVISVVVDAMQEYGDWFIRVFDCFVSISLFQTQLPVCGWALHEKNLLGPCPTSNYLPWLSIRQHQIDNLKLLVVQDHK